MMLAKNLKRAGELAGMLETVGGVLARLEGGEPLRLVLGSGGTASEIALSADYLKQLRGDIGTALKLRGEALSEDLRALGVEP